MSNTFDRKTNLSPEEKRAILAQFLAQKARQRPSFPLSFAQQRLWFLEQWEPHSSLHNLAANLQLSGPLDFTALAYSIGQIVQRHEALRTTIVVVDEQPVQLITSQLTLPLSMIDITHLSPKERETTCALIMQQEEQQPFDLEHGPLLRTTLIYSANEEYTLLLTMHHIISDGWSMSVFSHELSAFYTAYVRGIPPVLPELTIQYSDFAVWQRAQLQGEVVAEQLAYWKQELADAPSLLELPTDYPRPAAQTFHGSWQHFTLSSHLSEQLRALSLREGVTLFMLLQAAFALLLARYSGQDDIIIGSPIANRTRTELEGLIGFFVNTLALRTRLAGNPTFREVLAQVRKTTLGAYAHQDIPFEKLVEELTPERSLSYSPLFQVLFILQNVPQWQLKMADVTARKVGDEGNAVLFDLTLALVDDPQNLRGVFGYKSALFAPSTITRMIEHWQILLESIVANPTQRISDLPMLSKTEQHQLLIEWDASSHVPAQSACVHTLFEAQAKQIPDAIAVTFEGDSISYAALNRRSNQLAHSLRALNVRPTEPVAVILSRGPRQIIALLGVLKAGCPFACFDPYAPIARLQAMLAELAPTYLISEACYLQSHTDKAELFCQVVGPDGHILLLDVHVDQAAHPLPLAEGEAFRNKYHDWSYIESQPHENPTLNIHVTDPAYIAYTSGSTGTPKGIVESHHSFHHFLIWFSRACKLHSLRRIAQWASITFDPALDEIFATLCFGATLCMTTDTIMADPGAVVRWVQREQIMLLQTVPSFLRYMLQAIEDEQIEPSQHPFPHLEFLLMVGEVLPIELAERILQRLTPTVRLLNLYGPTEAIVATCYAVEALEPNRRSIPVGRPIDGCQVLILDQHQQICPIGVIGEIYIRGHYLSSGYFRRPEETQRAFVRNPLSPESEDRVYRTGDTGRWLPDGTIEFFGRRDHQVKIRGMRVELEEVEAVLLRHQSIRACAVVAHQDQRQTTRLVAYIVPSEAHTQSLLAEIQTYLRACLPDYMQPATFVMCETLPRTSSGKIDRRALPPPDWDDAGRKEVISAPRTPLEEMLADIWADVLQVKQVSIYDDFFALGGHSLLATRVIARIRDVLQVELSVRALFGAPTIKELAKCIETTRQAEYNTQMPPIKPVPKDMQLPLSFAQQRLWFLEQLTPGYALYTIVTAIQLEGVLNTAALVRSLNALVQRHEILRTSFGMNNGQPVQIIAPSLPIALPVINLSGLPAPEQEVERDRLILAEEQRSFDLAHGPLLYAWLLHFSEEEYVLLLTVHHSISDAWSTGIFLRELSALYNAYTTNIPASLPALPLQYADFAYWQRTWLQGNTLHTQLAYWKEQLARMPEVLALPTDRPRSALQTFDGAEHSFILPTDLADALKILSRRERVTLFMTLYTAFAILLARYSGQDAIVIGSPIANRTHTEIEGLIGFFVNTLVLPADLSGNPRFRDLLLRVREVILGAYIHQDLPFEKLVEELVPTRSLSYSPLFQVMFVLHNAPRTDLQLTNLSSRWLPTKSTTAMFDLTLMMADTTDGLVATFTYNTHLFYPATIERMQQHFQVLLSGIVAHPEQSISDLPLLTNEERQQVLFTWNETQYSQQDSCIHELFEAQAERISAAEAVIFGTTSLSYGQLNAQANQLANFLRKLRVQPEMRIGICMQRSPEMIVGLLAILKAGGAYVPLDPSYPPERLSFMLADAQVSILLTQQTISGQLTAQTANIVCLDTIGAVIAEEPTTNPEPAAMADNLAYVIYTSGSTGQPKGVAIEHRNAVLLLNWSKTFFTSEDLRGVLASTSICFDLSVFELFVPLSRGGTVILAENVLHIPALPAAHTITLINTVPSALTELLRVERLPRSVRTINLAGEPIPLALVEQAYSYDTVQRIFNLYGPSEDTTYSTYALLTKASDSPPPIGRPLANKQVYLLDQALQPVPVGIPGELYIGGDGLARGYLNRPELTAQRFIPHPFGTGPGLRLYKTGDLARYLSDGTIEYLGRSDYQVKLRGYRIELGEVEAFLRQHPQVLEAVAIIREDVPGDRHLVAYLVMQAHAEVSTSSLRSFLKEMLPEYMIPSAFVILEELPLTLNGKVDRNKLPTPEEQPLPLSAGYAAPQTNIEQTIAALWQEVLHREKVGIYDNFFDLGGHSLLLPLLQHKLQTAFERKLSMLDLFQHTTVSAQATYIQQQDQHAESSFQHSQKHAANRRMALRRQRQLRQQLDSDAALEVKHDA